MSEYYKMTFWERWLTGFLVNIPLTCLMSCSIVFFVTNQTFTGLAIWFGEAALLGLALASCPTAEIYRKPWWDKSE